jgi:hypothetical protein
MIIETMACDCCGLHRMKPGFRHQGWISVQVEDDKKVTMLISTGEAYSISKPLQDFCSWDCLKHFVEKEPKPDGGASE